MSDDERNERIAKLLQTPRCGDTPIGLDSVAGLLEMIDFAKPRRVLELGSYRGVSTECFLLKCDHVTIVDPWMDDSGTFLAAAWIAFQKRCGGYENLKVIRGASPDALANLKSNSFDLVYIDAVHTTEGVKGDIEASLRLIDDDGWIAGHDYVYTLPEGAKPPNCAVRCLLGEEGNWWTSNSHNVFPYVYNAFKKVKYFTDGSWLARKRGCKVR